MAMASLAQASLTDPGAVPLGARPLVTLRPATSVNNNSSSSNEVSNNNSNNNTTDPLALASSSPSSPQDQHQSQQLQSNPQSGPPTTTTDTTNTVMSAGGSSRRNATVRRCHKCQDNFKPARAHHDSVTGRCIVKFDHFCPWVNNSIGALNHKFFCLFLFYTCICCSISLLILLMRVIHCGYVINDQDDNDSDNEHSHALRRQIIRLLKAFLNTMFGDASAFTKTTTMTTTTTTAPPTTTSTNFNGETELFDGLKHDSDRSLLLFVLRSLSSDINNNNDDDDIISSNSNNNNLVLLGDDEETTHYKYSECYDFYDSFAVLGLFLSSLVFLVFTCTMGCEQMEAITTGQNKIARMKMRIGQAGTEFDRVTEEFNEMFGGNSREVALHWFLPTPVRYPRGMKKVVLGYDWDDDVSIFAATPYQEDQTAATAQGQPEQQSSETVSMTQTMASPEIFEQEHDVEVQRHHPDSNEDVLLATASSSLQSNTMETSRRVFVKKRSTNGGSNSNSADESNMVGLSLVDRSNSSSPRLI